VTLTFSNGQSTLAPQNISFTMWDKPKAQFNSTCFNLAEVFGNTSSSHFWDYSVGNAEGFSPNTTWTTMTFKQLNATNPKVGKDAARLVKIHMVEDCGESAALPWYGFSCQDAGSFYVMPMGIKSFSVLSREQYDYEDPGHCWVDAELGRSAASTNFKGCLAAVMAASLAGMLLTL
jgi:hypothetical protein